MSYATIQDIKDRMTRPLSAREEEVIPFLLEDAAAMIDAVAMGASDDVKKTVSCRMVIRALGDGSSSGVPMGATQGSISGLGYAQSWTMGSGASAGELYISKQDRMLLGTGNKIAAGSPVENLVPDKRTMP